MRLLGRCAGVVELILHLTLEIFVRRVVIFLGLFRRAGKHQQGIRHYHQKNPDYA